MPNKYKYLHCKNESLIIVTHYKNEALNINANTFEKTVEINITFYWIFL